MAVGTPSILASGEFTSSSYPHVTTSFTVAASGSCIVLAYANRNTTTMPTPSMSEGVGAPDTSQEQVSPFGANYTAQHVWADVAADDYTITISTGAGTFQEGRWLVILMPDVVTSGAADGGTGAGIDNGTTTGTLSVTSETGDRVLMVTFSEGGTVTGDGTELDNDEIQASGDYFLVQHMDGAASVDIGAEYSASGQHAWNALNFNAAATGESASATDGIELGDSVVASLAGTASATDGILLGDSVAGGANFAATATDGILLGQDIDTTWSTDSGPDGLLLGDSVVAAIANTPAVTDGVVLGDAVVAGLTLTAALTDGILLGQDIDTTWTTDSGPDGIALGDSVAATVAYVASGSDGIELGDSVAAALVYYTAATDGVTLGDSVITLQEYQRSLTDGLTLGDAVATGGQVVASDGVVLGDVVTASSAYTSALTDGILLGDSVLGLAAGSSVLTDGIVLGDGIVGLGRYTTTLADGLTLGDSAATSSAPTVTDVQVAEITPFLCYASATTDMPFVGTGYAIASASATPPTVEQIQAGQDSSGAAAVASNSGTPTNVIFLLLDGLAAETDYYVYVQQRVGAFDSAVVASSQFTTGDPDPTGLATSETTATGTIDPDFNAGTLSWVTTESATQPTIEQVQAGDDHTGADAVDSDAVVLSVNAVVTVNAVGLTGGVQHWFHYQYTGPDGGDSPVVSSPGFTTPSDSGPLLTEIIALPAEPWIMEAD